MQIVIDMSEEDYNNILNGETKASSLNYTIFHAISNGTPLPKGHGDIIDRSKIEYMRAIHDLKWGKITGSECATRIRYSAPTIIEGDKVESEE